MNSKQITCLQRALSVANQAISVMSLQMQMQMVNLIRAQNSPNQTTPKFLASMTLIRKKKLWTIESNWLGLAVNGQDSTCDNPACTYCYHHISGKHACRPPLTSTDLKWDAKYRSVALTRSTPDTDAHTAGHN